MTEPENVKPKTDKSAADRPAGEDIPIIAFSAWSGTGKTSVIEKLIPVLKNCGLRVAVIKHDSHHFEIDREGKDSWRFSRAGADVTVINSADKTALIDQRSLDLDKAISLIRDVDIILAEGYNQSGLPKIGICRNETGLGLRLSPEEYIAIISDEPVNGAPASIPVFSPEDIDGLAFFILGNCSAPGGVLN